MTENIDPIILTNGLLALSLLIRQLRHIHINISVNIGGGGKGK